MKRRLALQAALALLPAAVAVAAGTNDTVLYANGFERPGDALSLLSLPNIAGEAFKIATDTGIAPTDGRAGSGAFFFRADLLKDGYFYPNFRFPEPVKIPPGPAYLSASLKFAEQDPETTHLPGLGIFLLCGDSSRLVGWTNVALRAETADGWQYLYTRDLSGHVEEGTASGIMVRILRGVAGETVRLLIDDVRLTRTNPVPAPTESEYRVKRDLFERIAREWETEAGAATDRALAERIGDRLRGLRPLAEAAAATNAESRARFVGEMTVMEKDYWRYKLLDLAGRKRAAP